MNIQTLHLLEGAKKAEGLSVVIDVFRAFTAECYMYNAGAKRVIAVGKLEEAFALKEEHPDWLLAGERNGIMVEGFDFGNSPAAFEHIDLKGKTLVHTTSAGVQGLSAAGNAKELLAGSLVNASATARYIKGRYPELVSLIAMGWNGVKETEEDELCAEYLSALLKDQDMRDIKEKALYLQYQEGKKFFDPKQKDVFPERDFWLSIDVDRFDHVLKVKPDGFMYVTDWIQV